MGLTACLIRKGIEDAEGRRPETDRKPCNRCRLLHDYGKSAAKKLFHRGLLSGFRFQSNKERCLNHGVLLISKNEGFQLVSPSSKYLRNCPTCTPRYTHLILFMQSSASFFSRCVVSSCPPFLKSRLY